MQTREAVTHSHQPMLLLLDSFVSLMTTLKRTQLEKAHLTRMKARQRMPWNNEVNNEVNNITLISHAFMKHKLTTTTSEDDTTAFTSGASTSSSFHTLTASSINSPVEPAWKKSSKHSSLVSHALCF